MRRFVGIEIGREAAPDETTICKFLHLIEAHGLGAEIFATVSTHLATKGVKIGIGTIMDATIIAAPSSTKNAGGERDPEMQQVKKGNQWHFGMKARRCRQCRENQTHGRGDSWKCARQPDDWPTAARSRNQCVGDCA